MLWLINRWIELVVGWFEERIMSVRGLVVRCKWGGRLGCELTAIMWIARPCVAHYVEMFMKCLNVICVNPFPIVCLKCKVCVRVMSWQRMFHVFLKPKVAMSSNKLWPILAIQIEFGRYLKNVLKEKGCELYVEWFYYLKCKVTSRYGRYALIG